eukprot:gene8467-10399_t
MKLIVFLIGFLFTITLASAQSCGGYQCGSTFCFPNQVCVNATSCVYPFNDVKLSSKLIGTWFDGSRGKTYSQYDITITNFKNKNLIFINIGTDSTFVLRDNSSLWNMVRLANGDLVLPSYQQSINAFQSYTFGFILEGTTPANLLIKAFKKNLRRKNEAPGIDQWALPLLGNLTVLSKEELHLDFFKMSKDYGKIFRFWIGDHYTLIVNDPVLIREIWVKNFENFVNRPHFPTMNINSNGYINLAFSDEPIWRHMKQLVGGLFTKTSLKQMASDVVESQCTEFIDALKQRSKSGQPVNTGQLCKKYSLNIILNYILSEKISYNDDESGKLDQYIEEFIKDQGSGRIDDFIDILKPFTLFYRKYLKYTPSKRFADHIRTYYEKHKLTLDPKDPKDFFDSLIVEAEENKTISPDQVILLIMDLIAAGTDTPSGTINNFFVCMANNPEIQEKGYQELVNVIGKGNSVKISDRLSTPYVNAMMKELLRYKTIAPLGVPRAANRDITIDGVFIPGGTHLLQNIYACHHSDQYWDKPFLFNPDRFLKDEKANENIAFIPFGVGSRNCIGFSLAYDEMYVAIANILMNFQIQSVDGNKIDESEAYPKFEIKAKLVKKNFRSKKEAPGIKQWALPILGNLTLLGKNPHLDFFKMSKEYGKIFRFWIGDHYTLIVNDPVLIRKIWVKNFDNFVNRPHYPTIELNSVGYINLALSDEVIWRQMKQLIGGLFTKTSLNQMATGIIENEVTEFIDILKERSKSGEPIHPGHLCKKYSLNIILKYLFSESVPYTNEVGKLDQFIQDIETLFKEEGSGRLDDCIDILKPFSFFIRKYLLNTTLKKISNHIRTYYEQHKSNLNPQQPKDFFDTLIIESEINKTISKEQVIIVALDLIAAGTDTSSGTINNLFMCMVNYPEFQEKAYQELVNVIGKGNRVKISDRQSTPYINAMMKELLRYKTIGPLGVPRASTNDITIDDVFIPGGTHLLQNIYACHHSDQYWDKPFQFNPDRFLKNDDNDRDKPENIAYIPFGVGSRNCIGFSLAYDEVYCAIANILMNFQIQSVDGNKIDESEGN